MVAHGQLSPVWVVADVDRHGRFIVVDGFRRVRALRGLHRDMVTAVASPLDPTAALIHAYQIASGRARTILEEAWLIEELLGTSRLSHSSIGIQLGRTQSWVSRRLSIVKVLPLAVQAQVQRGAVCPHAAMKFLVPMARAMSAHCERLVETIAGEKLSTRQIGQLYQAWRAGDAEQRDRIVNEPLLYLRAHAEITRRPEFEKDTPAMQMLRDLGALAALCWRARSRVRAAVEKDPSIGRYEATQAAWRQAGGAFTALCATVKEATDVGPGHAGSDSCAVG